MAYPKRMAMVRVFDGLGRIYYAEEILSELSKIDAKIAVRFQVRDEDKRIMALTIYVYCNKKSKVYDYCWRHRFEYRKATDYRDEYLYI